MALQPVPVQMVSARVGYADSVELVELRDSVLQGAEPTEPQAAGAQRGAHSVPGAPMRWSYLPVSYRQPAALQPLLWWPDVQRTALPRERLWQPPRYVVVQRCLLPDARRRHGRERHDLPKQN
jgi:hypothetical protein